MSSKSATHLLIVITMLFAIVGQAFVSASMNFSMTFAEPVLNAKSTCMGHHQMNTDRDELASKQAQSANTLNCCDSDCTCPMSIGSSASLVLLSRLFFQAPAKVNDKIDTNPQDLLHSVIPPLYRPPIIA